MNETEVNIGIEAIMAEYEAQIAHLSTQLAIARAQVKTLVAARAEAGTE